MDRSGLVWIGTIVAVLVFLDLLFVELRRIFREGKRVLKRLDGYTGLPIFSLLAAGGNDIERIVRAVDALAPLIGRGQRAIAVVRRYIPKGSSPG